MKKGAKDLRGKRPKGQMTGGANDLGAKDLGAKDRGGKSPTPTMDICIPRSMPGRQLSDGNVPTVLHSRARMDVKHFCGMLDGLAFLPLDDVLEGLTYLRDNPPEGLESLIDYFDSTCVWWISSHTATTTSRWICSTYSCTPDATYL